jgi:hypothetical protein
MKQLVLIVDVAGYTNRLRQLEATGYEVIGITPADIASPGFLTITAPEEWLPVSDPFPPEHRPGWTAQQRKSWWKSNIHAIAAIQQMDLRADAYWIIESDCAASVRRWKALFDDHADNPDDICTTCVRTRFEEPGRERWRFTPSWANYVNLGAMYRMSRFAVDAIIAASVEMREVPSENTYVSVVHRAGGKLGRLNRTSTHMNNQTMKSKQSKVILNPALVNHPIKSNTYGF